MKQRATDYPLVIGDPIAGKPQAAGERRCLSPTCRDTSVPVAQPCAGRRSSGASHPCPHTAGSPQTGASITRQATGLLFALSLLVWLVLGVCLGAWPQRAQAAWPVEGGGVVLGFEQAYTAPSGEHLVHRGIDLAASAGDAVVAPIGGTVAFVGQVPVGPESGAAVGHTTLAVSIDLADGRRVTLMPFSAIGVEQGQLVQQGQLLGTLAAEGDYSSNMPHVHLGLRQGGRYLDPTVLLGAGILQAADGSGPAGATAPIAAAAVERSARPPADAAGVPVSDESAVAATRSVASEAPEASPTPGAAGVPGASAVPRASSAQPAAAAGSVTSGGVRLQAPAQPGANDQAGDNPVFDIGAAVALWFQDRLDGIAALLGPLVPVRAVQDNAGLLAGLAVLMLAVAVVASAPTRRVAARVAVEEG